MAYNKSKGKQKHGDVIYDKDTDTQIDFEQDEIKFRTGGSIRGSFANTGLVVTGTIGGFTSISGSGDITYGGKVSGSGDIHGNSITASNDFQVGRNSHFGHRFSSENHTVINSSGVISSSAVANHYFRSSLTTDGAVTAVGSMACSDISGSGFHLTNAFTCSHGAFRISSGAKINKFSEISSSTAPASFGQINVQEMFTVSTAGVVFSSASVSAPVLSGSSATCGGINVGEGVFTVSNAGAVVGAGLNNSSGGITNAGSIAGATTISGSGALSVGAGATLAGALNLQNGGITNAGSIFGATHVYTDQITSTEAVLDFTEGGSATGMYIELGDPDTRVFKLDATGSMFVYDKIKVGASGPGGASKLMLYGTPGDIHASGTMSGSNARFSTATMETLSMIGQLTASAAVHVTGSNPKLAIGDIGGVNPNDGMLFIRPSDTNNRALCLMQGKELDGNRVIFAVTGSGQVIIGGGYFGGVLSISGSTAEKLISAKSDSLSPAFEVAGNGDTNISGSLRAKSLHMTSHKFAPGGSTAHFVRFDTNGSDSVQNDNNKLVAPFAGKLIKVVARATSAPGSTVIGLHRNGDGAQNVGGTTIEDITVDMASANTTYTFNFTDTANYGSGDIVGVKFNPSSDPGTVTLTSVWEFDQHS